LSKNSNLKTDIFSSLHEKYPNAVSMRGDMLAESFSAVLRDYEERRNEMPGSTEQLLDGLWTVEGKYPNNPTLAVSSPGVFVFGLDKVDEIAAAVWSDETGEIYSLSYVYSPWPEGGWVVPPSVQDLADRANKNQYGVEWGALPEDYLPPTILWTCSLTSGD
jgi:hypothetical protein